MTKQTWTAVVSAILFVVSAAAIAMVPVKYVVWAPGPTQNLLGQANGRPLVAVSGVQTYPTSGELMLTTVAVTRADAELSLPEALYAHWIPDRAVMPRDVVYPAGSSLGDVREREVEMMDSSQSEAVAAAIQAAGLPIQRVPRVVSVATAGPSDDRLEVGDLILRVDGKAVTSPDEVDKIVDTRQIGDQVTFSVERDKAVSDVTVTTVSSKSTAGAPIVGVTLDAGYRHSVGVEFGVDETVGGPSGGVMFALAIYDKLTPSGLVGDTRVAGSGEIDGTGKIGPVGAIQSKVVAAKRDGAAVFLVPESNCADLGVGPAGIRVVSIGSLGQAIDALGALDDPARQASVKGCS